MIITINSKSGFEAILQNKDYVIHKFIYETFQKKDKINNIKDLKIIIKNKKNNSLKVQDIFLHLEFLMRENF